jgi:acyl-CoA reductase-like NAD-dependent aldehyde dehydrogenase
VDGVCYNAGQSCCGVERIYVHEAKYDQFVEKAKSLFEAYTLGDPFDPATSLGPMALPSAPALLDGHVCSSDTSRMPCRLKGLTWRPLFDVR